MNAEQNERLTLITLGAPYGELLRQYWQPAALVFQFNPTLDPRMAQRPVKAIQLLGQNLVLFKDSVSGWGLLDRDYPHLSADLSFGRLKTDLHGNGLRCLFYYLFHPCQNVRIKAL